MVKNSGGVLVSDIALGGLVIKRAFPPSRLGSAQASLALHSAWRRFEGLNGKMNDYNAFIQANTNVVKVYVPKSVRLNGGSVLAPYQINLRFSSFAPRQCSSKLGTALGLASVSAWYAAERGNGEEQRGCAGERHRAGRFGD